MSTDRFAGYISGKKVAGRGAQIVVEDPSTGEALESMTGLDCDQIQSAIAAARNAYDHGEWSRLASTERAAILANFVAALSAHSDDISNMIVREAGCPRNSGVMMAQVKGPLRHASEIIELFLSLPEVEENPLPLRERTNPMGQVIQSLRRYTPIGVVAGIAAYNFPFYTALWKIMPALITGNTLVLRPSPLTPLSATILADAADASALPPGVLNIVIEGGVEGGKLLSTDRDIDMVAFTGSTTVGQQIMVQAAPTMKRLQLELGGKSAQIFLPDALDQVARSVMGVMLAHAGQGCALGTRIFVPEDSKPALLEEIAVAVSAINVGPADNSATQMGPVISRAQVERCAHYVKAAVENGGRVVIGGKPPSGLGGGFYFEPTVLDLPDNRNPAAQDEIFGPVVAVIGYRDLDHAVAMANDSPFGLSGYVHGKDRQSALDVALKIKSGTVNVNAGLMSAYASAGGQRLSGIGRERGIEGLRIYQQLSCLNIGGT